VGTKVVARNRGVITKKSRSSRGLTIITSPHAPGKFEISDHPQTGACYVVAMPTHAKVIMEHYDGWTLNQRPWLKVIDAKSLRSVFAQIRDRRALVCSWLMWDPAGLPKDRRATLTTMYAEALDDSIANMLPQHQTWLNTFLRHAREFDGVVAHTPWMASKLTQLSGLRSAVMPSGYDTRILGEPRWSVPKVVDAAWYGTMVGKRTDLVRRLKSAMGGRLADLTGSMGRALVDRLQAAKTVVSLSHSNVRSYSTWRTWQAICSSAAIVTEPGDYWPLTPECCLEVPRIDHTNIDDLVRHISDLPPQRALEIAKTAHERLRSFTVANAIDEYLVPQTQAWLR
jgi:hypothetical protein